MDTFGSVELDFSSYTQQQQQQQGFNGVSLTLWLQQHGGSGVSLAFPPPLVSSHHSSLFYATTIDAAMPTIVGMAPKNQDAIDAAIVGTLADPKEARAGIRDVHFLPFNPVDKRTSLTYIDADGNWHPASKGAPEQIMNLCNLRDDAKKKVHAIIDKFAERGLRSLAVSRQEVPEKRTALELHGSLLVCCYYLIHQGMTVPKPFAGLLMSV